MYIYVGYEIESVLVAFLTELRPHPFFQINAYCVFALCRILGSSSVSEEISFFHGHL